MVAQSGIDLATAKGTATYLLYSMVQKEALVRAIADTLLISSIPLFCTLPLIFLFIKRKKRNIGEEQQELLEKEVAGPSKVN